MQLPKHRTCKSCLEILDSGKKLYDTWKFEYELLYVPEIATQFSVKMMATLQWMGRKFIMKKTLKKTTVIRDLAIIRKCA